MVDVDPNTKRPLPDEPLGDTDSKLIRTARERYQKAVDFDDRNRKDALDDLRFYAGEQWPAEIESQRRGDNRPVVTVNRMKQFVKAVTNDMRQNKPAINARPFDSVADPDTADILGGLIRNIESHSDAQIAYITGAECAAQCGIGHWRIITEYSSDDVWEQDIRIRRMHNPFAVTWDHTSVQITREDARYCFVEKEFDVETFKARFPRSSLAEFDFSQRDWGYTQGWVTTNKVRVAEYWTKTPEKRKLILTRENITIDVTDLEPVDLSASPDLADLASIMPEGLTTIYRDNEGNYVAPVREREVYRDKIEMRLINGLEVLEGPFAWPGKHIPIIPVIGDESYLDGHVLRSGIVRDAKDPQRLYNYWRSAQTELIALQPKVPFIGTPTNFEGVEDMWRKANDRNLPYLVYTPDEANGGQAPGRNAPPIASPAMAQEVLLAQDDMKATTGVYDPALGQISQAESGIAIQSRQQESDTANFSLIDNLHRAIAYTGEQLVDLIPKIYDSARTIRVLNPDDTTDFVPINQEFTNAKGEVLKHDLAMGKYDIWVTTGPSFATKRMQAVDGMIAFIQAVPDAGKVVMDLIAKNLDWPGAEEISSRLRKMLPPGLADPEPGEEPTPPTPPPPPDPVAMAIAQAETQKAQTDAMEGQVKAAEAQAKMAKMAAETEQLNLENLEKQLALAIQQGALNDAIGNQVKDVLTAMFAADAAAAGNYRAAGPN